MAGSIAPQRLLWQSGSVKGHPCLGLKCRKNVIQLFNDTWTAARIHILDTEVVLHLSPSTSDYGRNFAWNRVVTDALSHFFSFCGVVEVRVHFSVLCPYRQYVYIFHTHTDCSSIKVETRETCSRGLAIETKLSILPFLCVLFVKNLGWCRQQNSHIVRSGAHPEKDNYCVTSISVW